MAHLNRDLSQRCILSLTILHQTSCALPCGQEMGMFQHNPHNLLTGVDYSTQGMRELTRQR